MKRFALIALASCALAGCGGDTAPAEQADSDATVRGEVLGGTITDDMLPLDTVTSQSPSQTRGDDDESDPAPAAEPAPEQQAAPAPQPEPEPEPEEASEAVEEG